MFSAGSWGTAMAKVFADAGNGVMVHARRDEVVDAINTRRQSDQPVHAAPLLPALPHVPRLGRPPDARGQSLSRERGPGLRTPGSHRPIQQANRYRRHPQPHSRLRTPLARHQQTPSRNPALNPATTSA
ncbi:hypothetical protein [Streptomyces sp. NPDC005784]|uniref:hypothetical protein n=1 Tax=Streptomyces sp. NPDC005784 TaxID=3364731 RepID=UPI0036BBAB90